MKYEEAAYAKLNLCLDVTGLLPDGYHSLRGIMQSVSFHDDVVLEPGGEGWCMSPEGAAAYRAEIARLKTAYADRIRIFCGVEQDLCSETGTEEYDYVIGAVHCLSKDGKYVSENLDVPPELNIK